MVTQVLEINGLQSLKNDLILKLKALTLVLQCQYPPNFIIYLFISILRHRDPPCIHNFLSILLVLYIIHFFYTKFFSHAQKTRGNFLTLQFWFSIKNIFT